MKFMLRIFLLVVLALIPLGSSHASGQLFFMQNPNIGEPVPEFTLPLLSGKSVSLTQYRGGKSAIVFFWATWCPHCREALEDLNKKAGKLEEKGIKVVLVDIGEEAQEVREHLTRHKIVFDAFLDQESSLSEPYGIIGVPTFFFVDKDGVVRAVEHSMPDNYEEILLKNGEAKNIAK